MPPRTAPGRRAEQRRLVARRGRTGRRRCGRSAASRRASRAGRPPQYVAGQRDRPRRHPVARVVAARHGGSGWSAGAVGEAGREPAEGDHELGLLVPAHHLLWRHTSHCFGDHLARSAPSYRSGPSRRPPFPRALPGRRLLVPVRTGAHDGGSPGVDRRCRRPARSWRRGHDISGGVSTPGDVGQQPWRYRRVCRSHLPVVGQLDQQGVAADLQDSHRAAHGSTFTDAAWLVEHRPAALASATAPGCRRAHR